MDLVTGLGKLSGLFVIGSNTTFGYKGKDVTIAKAAEDNRRPSRTDRQHADRRRSGSHQRRVE